MQKQTKVRLASSAMSLIRPELYRYFSYSSMAFPLPILTLYGLPHLEGRPIKIALVGGRECRMLTRPEDQSGKNLGREGEQRISKNKSKLYIIPFMRVGEIVVEGSARTGVSNRK